MTVTIKRLGPGDEAILDILARDDADFDLDGRSEAQRPLKPSMAQRYLASPSVLHWIAFQDGVVTGFLYCAHLLLRTDPGQELLLYEIGVRKAHRRKGVGRALLDHMARWMQSNGSRTRNDHALLARVLARHARARRNRRAVRDRTRAPVECLGPAVHRRVPRPSATRSPYLP